MQKTQEIRVRSLGGEDPLEDEMATHSGILAWRIPWAEEPGGLQSMGSQRIGTQLSDLACNMQVKAHRPCLYTLSYCAYVNNSNWILWSSFLFHENQMFKKNIKLCINWESTGRDSVHF